MWYTLSHLHRHNIHIYERMRNVCRSAQHRINANWCVLLLACAASGDFCCAERLIKKPMHLMMNKRVYIHMVYQRRTTMAQMLAVLAQCELVPLK